MHEEKHTIRISVRNLVEFILRSGDLDHRHRGGRDTDSMLEGSRIHRKLQKAAGPGYRAEVSLSRIFDAEEFRLKLEGRADGIFEEEGLTVIDEIKGMYRDLSTLTEPLPLHLAQARCYAAIYSQEQGLDRIGVRMTYCSLETEEIRYFVSEESPEVLEEWLDGLVEAYLQWARYLYHHQLERNASLKVLEFPYPYRPGQKEMAVSVYRALARERDLFMQAPTGVGKTLSVLFPALKAVGEEKIDRIFYLTARTITRSVAEETMALLATCGMRLTSLTITAKEKLCFQEKADCDPETCPYAKGHFDRVNAAVYRILQQEQQITREILIDYAARYQVCPFEFCLDISDWVDALICDYNYVFDPNVRLKRYFGDSRPSERYLFLVDEAHNLVGRARDMFSAGLTKEEILEVRKQIADRRPALKRKLAALNRLLLAMKKEATEVTLYEDLADFYPAALSAFGELETWLTEEEEIPEREELLEFYFLLRDFLSAYENRNEGYRIYSEIQKDGSFLLRLFCIDPSGRLRECLDQAVSTIFFSATLLPVRYYKKLLTGREEDYAVYTESPFPGQNRILLLGRDISSRYSRRGEEEYRKAVAYIREVTAARRGNYMVFFPSYQVMKEVTLLWEQEQERDPCPTGLLLQKTVMREEEKEAFLAEFHRERENSLAAFCVMGGSFAEGIDLREDALIGVIVIGTGLPMVCTEQELLRDYFAEKEGMGYEYAFLYPGFNKVMQAAGRVIRTMKDRGVILLLDDRFLRTEYRDLFPREWSDYQVTDRFRVRKDLEAFWERAGRA